MKYVREISFFLSSTCRIDHMFFCCVLLYSTGLFFCRFGFFWPRVPYTHSGSFLLQLLFWNRFLLISLEITYLNIYTHNNKFFFVCFDSCMRYFKFFKFFCGFFMDFFCFHFCSRQFLISMMGNVKFPNHKKILNFTFHSFLKKQSKLSHLGFLNWRLGGQNGEGCCKNYIKGTEKFSGEWHKKLKKKSPIFFVLYITFLPISQQRYRTGYLLI